MDTLKSSASETESCFVQIRVVIIRVTLLLARVTRLESGPWMNEELPCLK